MSVLNWLKACLSKKKNTVTLHDPPWIPSDVIRSFTHEYNGVELKSIYGRKKGGERFIIVHKPMSQDELHKSIKYMFDDLSLMSERIWIKFKNGEIKPVDGVELVDYTIHNA